MRLVVKVGSAVLSETNGALNKSTLGQIVGQLHQVRERGHEVLLVSSGAIAAGTERLNKGKITNDLRLKQAAAAVGQLALMEAYENALSKYEIIPAQVLLTREDLNHHERYLNIRNTLLKLLSLNVIPIINENDCVSTEEIQVGDNDTLSAIVAAKVEADKLIILSNVGGLHDLDESGNITDKIISDVETITTSLEKKATKTKGASHTVGGMVTKIRAAKMATSAGIETWIASGHRENILIEILDGVPNVGTRFISQKKKIATRHSWIAFGRKPKGTIIIDVGAKSAILTAQKSLLPSGVKSVRGQFSVGDTVNVKVSGGAELARGLVNFSSEEIQKIKGHQSQEIEKLLGRSAAAEVIHRDNLVIL